MIMRPLRCLLLSLLPAALAACAGDAEPEQVLDASVIGVPDASPLPRDAQVDAGTGVSPAIDAAPVPADADTFTDTGAADTGTADAGADDAADDAATTPDAQADAPPTPFERVYRIALRVHRGDSGLSPAQLAAALEEVNHIWWSQASICFEVDVTSGDAPRADGFDLWFHRGVLGCGSSGNGVYCGDHDIHTLDAPSLGSADNTQWDSKLNPARTGAHELGHGLRLGHYNGYADSNDSLMSSGRQGFKLHAAEVTTARARAAQMALPDTSPAPCAAPPR